MAVDFNPMNLQLMVPKSTEVSQLQQNMHHQVNAQQDNQLAKQKETYEVNQRTVRRHEEAEDGKVKDDPDRERRQGGGYSGKRHRRDGEDGEDEAARILAEVEELRRQSKNLDIARGSLIDISL